MAGAGIAFVPWLLQFAQRGDFAAGLEKSVNPLLSVGYTFLAFFAGYNVGPSVAQLHVDRGLAALLPHLPYLAVYGLLGAGALCVALGQWRSQREAISLSVCLVLGPVVGALAISQMLPSITYNVRYALAALPFFYLGIAAGLAGLRPWPRTALLVALLALSGLSLWRGHTLPEYLREDNRAAAQYIAQEGRAGEGVVLQSSVPFEHYFHRDDLVLHALPRGLTKGELTGMAQTWVRQHRSLRLVECRSWTVDPQGTVRATLDQLMTTERQADFAGVRVTQYGR
jgi:hypothetical protein